MKDFEGLPLTTITWNGEAIWIPTYWLEKYPEVIFKHLCEYPHDFPTSEDIATIHFHSQGENTTMTLTFADQTTKVDETFKARDIPENKPIVLQYISTDKVDSPKGESQLHKFYKANEKGAVSKETVGIWGCTILNNELSNVATGSFVKVTRVATPAGKNYLNFKVQVGTLN